MNGSKRPKVTPIRTSLVDTGWEDITGRARSDRPPAGSAGAIPPPRRPEATMDVADEEVITEQRDVEELKHLLASNPWDDPDESTKVMSPPEQLLRARDSDLDALLASDEERRLPPPPRATRSLPLPPPAPRAPIFEPKRPTPPPPPLERTEDLAELELPLSSPLVPVDAARGQAEPENLSAYSPPSRPPPRYAAKVDTTSIVTEQEQKKGTDFARLVLVLGVTLPLAVGIGVFIGMMVFGTEATPPAAAVAPTPSVRNEPEPRAEAPKSLVERAAEGDFKAIDELKSRPPDQRTARETIALAQGRSQSKRLGLEGFAAQLKKKPDLLEDPKQVARLKEFLSDRETTNQAALVLLELDSPLGPDLLYDVWVGTKGRNETTTLAEELVRTKEFRSKASPALGVALDLRNLEDCESAKELLPKAAEHGDRRSLHLLGKLVSKRGCGPQKRDDCYACLRSLEDDEKAIDLMDAMKAVRSRPAPKL